MFAYETKFKTFIPKNLQVQPERFINRAMGRLFGQSQLQKHAFYAKYRRIFALFIGAPAPPSIGCG
ncbi:hypothetical protein DQG23_20590 [Paenibacillus contaminans]|uniref:Uncharacterized protein n=1 Tax=Paenibacillus contaminans TaxID=450362 RepID=A0A329MIK0_9BACL|nr:hypothetical protein DQG23_20590 [Paenibacillus contaminans]